MRGTRRCCVRSTGAVRSASVRHGQRATKGSKEDADKLNGVKYGPYFYTEAELRKAREEKAQQRRQESEEDAEDDTE